jgi:hypothetical protein
LCPRLVVRETVPHGCACMLASQAPLTSQRFVLIRLNMSVTVERSYVVCCESSSHQWKVSPGMLKQIGADDYVKIKPYDAGFVRMVFGIHTDLPKNTRLTLAQADGFKEIVRLRNSAAFEPSAADGSAGKSPDEMKQMSLRDALFGPKAGGKPKAHTKPRMTSEQVRDLRQAQVIFDVPVPAVGSLLASTIWMVKPGHPCEELVVKLDAGNISKLVKFIRDFSADSWDVETLQAFRSYGAEGPGVWRMGSAGIASRVRKAASDDEADDESGLPPKKWKVISGARKALKSSPEPSPVAEEAEEAAPIGDA